MTTSPLAYTQFNTAFTEPIVIHRGSVQPGDTQTIASRNIILRILKGQASVQLNATAYRLRVGEEIHIPYGTQQAIIHPANTESVTFDILE